MSTNNLTVKATWKNEESKNGYLLRQLFDLLLRDPSLTSENPPLKMLPKMMKEKEGSKR